MKTSSTSFSTALCLASLSALAFAKNPKVDDQYPRFEFPEHLLVMQGTQVQDLTREVCHRSVDRLTDNNIDFNNVLEENTGTWIDSTFTGWDRIFWEDYRPYDGQYDESARQYDVEFKSIRDVFSSGYSMWGGDGLTFEDPTQGGLGDCWMIAASSVVAQDPSRIQKVFLTEDLNSAGVYAVQLYMMGIPVTVTVDDYLPFRSGTDYLIYGRPGPDGGLWMPILEKAAAKLFGNYESLVGGWMGPAIQALTGAPFYDVTNSDMSVDELWNYIDGKVKSNWMVTCGSFTGTGSDKDQNSIGVPFRHAFTINGTIELSTGEKLIQVRNPWGQETYHGPWSDKDYRWNETNKKEANWKDKQDGLWWITAKDYHESMRNTQANPDVSTQHMSYFAQLNLDYDVLFEDKVVLKSNVAQTVYVSAYTYDMQHIGNGNCGDNRDGSSAYIKSNIDNTWRDFDYMSQHYDAVEMYAGQEMEFDFYVEFKAKNLLPTDYSFVAWAEKEPVNIDVTTHDKKSASFPNFQMSDSVKVYDFNGNLINNDGSTDGSSTGGDGTDGGSTGGDGTDGGSTGGDGTDGGSTEPEIVYPIISKTSTESMNHKFQFLQGENDVTSSVAAINENTFEQLTAITIDGKRFFFEAEYFYDGTDFKATTNFARNCDGAWEKSNGGAEAAGWSMGCGEEPWTSYTEISTSFDSEEINWGVVGSEFRSQFYVGDGAISTYYISYVDFDNLVWSVDFWHGGMLQAHAEWRFHNSKWNWTARNVEEENEHDSTVKDPNTKVVITDTSGNESSLAREYELLINDTYSIKDIVEVKDPWNFQQQIKTSSVLSVSELQWLNMHIHFDGQIWQQTLDWDGLYKTTFELSSKPEDGDFLNFLNLDMTSTVKYSHPQKEGFYIDQEIDMNKWWKSTIGLGFENGIDKRWEQSLLMTGEWTQSYFVGNVLIWQDSWNMDGTGFNPFSTDSHPHAAVPTTLLAQGEQSASVEESEKKAAGYSTAAIVSASVLGLSLFACVNMQKRKVDDQHFTRASLI